MAYTIFSIFPSFSFLGLFILNITGNIFVSKIDKKFQDIVKEEDQQELINVAIFNDKAYWVHENIFYEADIINNEINKESSRPVNVFEMSSYDISKMLFILDNLSEGQ